MGDYKYMYLHFLYLLQGDRLQPGPRHPKHRFLLGNWKSVQVEGEVEVDVEVVGMEDVVDVEVEVSIFVCARFCKN